MKQFFKNKYAQYVLIGVIVIVTLYLFGSQLRTWYRQFKRSQQNQDRLDKVGDRVDINNLSYTTDQYKRYADKLESAMAGWVTNEARIYKVFRDMQNMDDVEELISVFGTRPFNSWLGSSEGKTLQEWILASLDTGQVERINKNLNSKNIPYKF